MNVYTGNLGGLFLSTYLEELYVYGGVLLKPHSVIRIAAGTGTGQHKDSHGLHRHAEFWHLNLNAALPKHVKVARYPTGIRKAESRGWVL